MLPPKTILQSRYEIVRSIGQGGVGAVYEAQDIRLRNPVALKHLTLQGIQASKAFEQEAQLLSKLRHSALPRVIDHFTDAQGQFLVMDYIDGDDLGVQLQRGKAFSVNDVLRWSDKLLQALEYLHHQTPAILHRDIKPSNIKVTANDDVMLLDFGLAKGTIATQQLLTSSSIRGYTPLYAPLEQIQGSGTDERSDLFALAATMYHLMTGKPAADALSRAADVLQQQSDPLIEPRVLNQQIPHHVSQVLMQALSLNRSLRPASANAMRQALHNASHQPIHAAVGTTTILAPTAFVSNPQVSGATIVLNRAQNPRNIAK